MNKKTFYFIFESLSYLSLLCCCLSVCVFVFLGGAAGGDAGDLNQPRPGAVPTEPRAARGAPGAARQPRPRHAVRVSPTGGGGVAARRPGDPTMKKSLS